MVEEGKNSREVYFPQGSNWYDYHTGKFYNSGSVATIQNQPSDKVPLFLREGHIIFSQNVDDVTKSSQLNSEFILVGAFTIDERRSTETLHRY